MVVFCVITFSVCAATEIKGFTVEAGGYTPCVARLYNGRAGSFNKRL